MYQNGMYQISLLKRSDSNNFYLQYRDPVSGRKIRKGTGTTKKREAERLAGKWEIRAGSNWGSGRMDWQDFRERFELPRLEGLADGTKKKPITVLNVLDGIISPLH